MLLIYEGILTVPLVKGETRKGETHKKETHKKETHKRETHKGGTRNAVPPLNVVKASAREMWEIRPHHPRQHAAKYHRPYQHEQQFAELWRAVVFFCIITHHLTVRVVQASV